MYICKQFVPRSGPTECQAKSGSKLFETRIVFLKEFFEKVKFEKRSAEDPEVKKKNMKISQHAKSFKWYCIDCYRKLLMIIFKCDIKKHKIDNAAVLSPNHKNSNNLLNGNMEAG